MEGLNRTQRRQADRAARASQVNARFTQELLMFSSGGRHKKGTYRGTILRQVAFPLVERKRDGKVVAVVTAPIRRVV